MTDQEERLLHIQRVAAIQGSFALVHAKVEISDRTLVDRLTFASPDLIPILDRGDTDSTGAPCLLDVVNTIVSSMTHPDAVLDLLRPLGQRHAKLGLQPKHYAIFGEILIDMLEEALGPSVFNAFVRESWEIGYARVSKIMIRSTYHDERNRLIAQQLTQQVTPGLAPAAVKA